MTITNNSYTYSPEAIAYSAMRAEWRTEYKALSATIVELKAELRDLAKAGKPMRAAEAQSKLHYKRLEATEMMKTITTLRDAWKHKLAEGHVARTLTAAMMAAE